MHNFRRIKETKRARVRVHETRFIYGASPYLSNDIFRSAFIFRYTYARPRTRVCDRKPKLSYFTITLPSHRTRSGFIYSSVTAIVSSHDIE